MIIIIVLGEVMSGIVKAHWRRKFKEYDFLKSECIRTTKNKNVILVLRKDEMKKTVNQIPV